MLINFPSVIYKEWKLDCCLQISSDETGHVRSLADLVSAVKAKLTRWNT
jgi:hypothetical protein